MRVMSMVETDVGTSKRFETAMPSGVQRATAVVTS